MPVYGNAWDGVKRLLYRFLDWLAQPFTTDDPDDPEESNE